MRIALIPVSRRYSQTFERRPRQRPREGSRSAGRRPRRPGVSYTRSGDIATRRRVIAPGRQPGAYRRTFRGIEVGPEGSTVRKEFRGRSSSRQERGRAEYPCRSPLRTVIDDRARGGTQRRRNPALCAPERSAASLGRQLDSRTDRRPYNGVSRGVSARLPGWFTGARS